MSLTGADQLVRLYLRRDRVYIPVWLLALSAMVYASAAGTETLYSTTAERTAAAEAINSSGAVVALYGPILDPHSLGELAMTKMTVLYAVFVGLMFLFMARRHTRVDEERGLLELIGGTAIGRGAPIAAAAFEAVLVAVALGLLASGMAIAGKLPVSGSLLFGASWALTGLVVAAVTLVAAQLSPSSRTCAGIAAAVLGAAYLLRAVGDTYAAALSWVSFLGWNTQLRAWSSPRLWVLGLYVVLVIALTAIAVLLRARRDLGAGLFAERLGPPTGKPSLSSVAALQLKVLAPMLTSWIVAMAAGGLIFGAMAPGISTLLDSPSAQEMIRSIGGPGVLSDVMMAAILSMLAVIVTCFAIVVINRGSDDERSGRTEEVLATGAGRGHLFGVLVAISLIGSLVLLIVAGLFSGLGWGMAGDSLAVPRLVGAALVNTPAVWLVAAMTILAYAVQSRLAVLGWGFVIGFLALGLIAPLLKLPHWLTQISPYDHTPKMPGGALTITPLAVMATIALVLVVLGWWRFRTRDIH